MPKPQSGEREQEPDEVTEQQSCKVIKRPTVGGCESNRPGPKTGNRGPRQRLKPSAEQGDCSVQQKRLRGNAQRRAEAHLA